jgi:hypothetical protein
MTSVDRVEQVGTDIISAFKNGKVPHALAQAFIRRNIEVPSKHWTWGNRLIGVLRGHVYAGGFRQWEKLGRHVKKNERAFYILAPKLWTAKEDDPDRGVTSGETFVTGFRAVAVFGFLQTQGDPLPGAEDEAEFIEGLPLLTVAREWGLSVGIYSIEDDPYGSGFFVDGLGIGLGTKNLSTWAHELVHASDHRLQTYTGKGLESEVVAELGGAILLECLGYRVESDRGGAYEYITAYCEKHNRKVLSACTELLERSCRCVTYLLDEAQRLTQMQAQTKEVA